MSSGVECICRSEVFQDGEDNWWTRVCPSGVSQQGLTTPEDADRMTEIGIILYKQLQSAPTYRYALVGVEVDEFRTYSELTAMPPDISFSGLVLTSSLWQMMGSPVDFRIFAPGYLHPSRWVYLLKIVKPLPAPRVTNPPLRGMGLERGLCSCSRTPRSHGSAWERVPAGRSPTNGF
ncbi:MAG: hypothetical protein GDA56_22555 [Hormoscilla sp. GM7CHS1pb]|nr:hypothetical protein [Hormoscilla sp. GM7CHS1pb]